VSNRARVFCEKAEDLLPRLPADSFDSIVTDPPYGLEFMGKDWDSFGKAPTGGANFTPDGMGKGFKGLPNYRGSPNPTCRKCKGMKRGQDRPGFTRCRCAEPDFPNVTLNQMHAFQAWCEQWVRECYRVLKPGGYLLAFGGTRTYHRLACAIEDAGFEVRDSLHWIYGSGFPKGLDVSKAIDKAAGAQREVTGASPDSYNRQESSWQADDGAPHGMVGRSEGPRLITAPATEDAARWQGWNVAMKPAHEPIIMARKPLSEGTVAANVLRWGTGALNIGACKVGTAENLNGGAYSQNGRAAPMSGDGREGAALGLYEPGRKAAGEYEQPEGRWPPNLLLTHSADCQVTGTRRVHSEGDYLVHMPEMVQAYTCAPGCPVAELDAQSGTLTSGANPARRGSDKFRNAYGDFTGQRECIPQRGVDTGGASRFFPQLNWDPELDFPFLYQAKAPKKERPRIVTDDGRVIQHPTVKPLALMRWLVRLATPPGGTVGDFFCGTGPTVQAALDEGMRCVAADQDPDSVALTRVRLAAYAGVKFTVPAPAEPAEAAS
jgi:site-specific DNA-methyltransferase (adenine-specific)